MEAVLELEILLPVAAVVVVHFIQVPLVQVQQVKVTMVVRAVARMEVRVVVAVLLPSVSTALVVQDQVPEVLVVLVVLHRLLAHP